MYNIPPHILQLAKGAFYVTVGALLALRAFGFMENSFSTLFLEVAAAYFIIYGFFISGFYDKLMRLAKFK